MLDANIINLSNRLPARRRGECGPTDVNNGGESAYTALIQVSIAVIHYSGRNRYGQFYCGRGFEESKDRPRGGQPGTAHHVVGSPRGNGGGTDRRLLYVLLRLC